MKLINLLKIYIYSFIFLISSSLVNASDIYVSQSGSGSQNGSSGNPHSISWLNTGANQVAGNTYHLVGTFNDINQPLVIVSSGSSGSPITFLFENGANFTAPVWPVAGAIQLNSVSWIIIDGGVNGIIQNTDNGTLLGHRLGSRGVGGSNSGSGAADHTIIRNLIVTNIYTKVDGGLLTSYNSSVDLPPTEPFLVNEPVTISGNQITITSAKTIINFEQVQFSGTSLPTGISAGVWYWVVQPNPPLVSGGNIFEIATVNLGNPITLTGVGSSVTITSRSLDDTRAGYPIDIGGNENSISNCIVSDGDAGLSWAATSSSCSNIYILNNTILNCNHSILIGFQDHSATVTNLIVSGNYLDHWDVWDCPGDSQIHLDGIIMINNAFDQTSVVNGIYINNNLFGKYVGSRTTSSLFLDFGGQMNYQYVYNNLFLCVPRTNTSNGMPFTATWGGGFARIGANHCWLVNNTFVGTITNGQNFGGTIGIGGSDAHAYNNVGIAVGGISMAVGENITGLSPSNQGTNNVIIISNYFTTQYSDYNIFNAFGNALTFGFALADISNGNPFWLSGIIGPNLLDWQTYYEDEWFTLNAPPSQDPNHFLFNFCQVHCDPHSSTTVETFRPGTYIPFVNSVASGFATNLTPVASLMPGITKDFNGNPRPSSGNWDAGAFNSAKDIYITQLTSGSDTGADCNNAHSLSWLNDVANWGTSSTQINPGDTVHLCGTFTSVFTVPSSGTLNSPITIHGEVGANFTSTIWPASGAINANNVSNLIFENFLIQNTGCGTGMITNQNTRGFGSSGGPALLYNCILRNLVVTNIYKNIAQSGDNQRNGYGLDLSGSGITVSNCFLSDGDGPLGYTSQQNEFDHDIYLVNNTILNGNHLLQIGSGQVGTSTLSNLVIAGNFLDHTDVFDETSGARHLDAIIFAGSDSAPLTIRVENVYIYNNTFGPHIGVHNTSSCFGGYSAPGWQWVNWYVFNNLFQVTSNAWGNGFIGGICGTGVYIVNNTMLGACPLGTAGGTNSFVYNNLCSNGTGWGLRSFADPSVFSITNNNNPSNANWILQNFFQQTWSDYNNVSGASPVFGLSLNDTNSTTIWPPSSLGFDFHGWQTWFNNEWGTGGSQGLVPPVDGLFQWCQLHADPHSTTTTVVFNAGTYVPTIGSVADNAATNLTFLSSIIPQITTDFNGNLRPSSGNWTVGALQAQTITPTSPSNSNLKGHAQLKGHAKIHN